nr:DEAD/DEAH box helicase [Mangrovicoccus sp. HB161399]
MSFDQMGLKPRLLEALAAAKITDPTPIQEKAIPHALEGRDVMGLAQTGTGKTMAFGLPLAQKLMHDQQKCKLRSAQALILAPTRELAQQIFDNLSMITDGAHLRLAIVTGGASVNRQAQKLSRGVHLLVATPGRLLDLIDRQDVSLHDTRFLVLDEADQMLDIGFIHALRRIASLLPKQRQTMLFSATMADQMEEIAQAYLTDPVKISVTPPGKTADRIEQEVRFIEQPEKTGHLIDLLGAHPSELALVFTRTKHGADRLARAVEKSGFAVGAIHGNKSQGQRERALKAFRAGQLKVLIATDVAARGIDIPEVRHVYNFDLPNVPDNYVHRIGRTARAGRDGRAVAFCSSAETKELKQIEKLIGIQLETSFGERPLGATHRPAKSGGGRGGKPAGAPKHGRPQNGEAKPGNGANRPRRSRNRRRPAKASAA